MGFGQPAADDQFLADDHCLLVADHLEPFEPSGRASLDRDEVTDGAEIYSERLRTSSETSVLEYSVVHL